MQIFRLSAGVDVEPGAPSNLLDGIRFVDCIASGNVGAGFNLSPGYGGASAKKNVTISFERCHVRGGLGTGLASGGGNPKWPMGRVDIKDCSVSKTAWSGISFRNAISGLHVAYRNISLTDVAIGWQRTRGAHSGTGVWPWWNASVGPPMEAWPIDISHTSHDVTAPVGQLSITGLRATDKLSRPFLHAEAPHNLSLAQGGLRQVLIEGMVQVESAKQCEPVGIASSAEWGVDLSSLSCSKRMKTDDTDSSETREEGHGAPHCPAIDWRNVPPPPPPTLRGEVAHTSRILTAGPYCHAGETGGTCAGYLDYGGPTCVLSANETLLCFFCGEKKIHSDDNNWADVVLRRSFDRGRTWQPLQVVASDNNASTPRREWKTYGNTAAVLDRSTGKIILLFDKNNT